jgi:hypothetical protein
LGLDLKMNLESELESKSDLRFKLRFKLESKSELEYGGVEESWRERLEDCGSFYDEMPK